MQLNVAYLMNNPASNVIRKGTWAEITAKDCSEAKHRGFYQ
jgi:hypothetical protein